MDLSNINNVVKTDKKLTGREVARVIRQALCAEQDAVHMYETIVDSTEDSDVKKVLQSIADEEKIHIGELSRLLLEFDKDQADCNERGATEVEELIGE